MSASIDKLLYAAAAALADAEERGAFLDHACRDDPELRNLLEGMLAVREEAEEFFTFPLQVPAKASPGSPGKEEGDLETHIGRYRLIGRIGAGGCGVVYLAEQQEPVWRKVALKIVRPGMDTESVIARFEIERQALALMDHPFIARVLDAGATAAGRPYFVMELADGEKITTFCDRKRLGLRERLELFILVCEAIQHAHQKGVIHRDIKPSNVLVREHDGRVEPKVIDFGIAKVTGGGPHADGTATNAGQFIGTPAYMSPEQAEGGVDIDTRSDIYSLGVLLCELLAGSPPVGAGEFGGRGVREIRNILREGTAEMPSTRLRRFPREETAEIAARRGLDAHRLPLMLEGDLDWIMMKALDPDRQRRYETANGLAKDVRRHLDDEPVLARPPARWYLLGKLVRRNRVTFAAGGVALLGLLGGLGFATWLFLRERDARQEQARLRLVAEMAMANEVRLREETQASDRVARATVLLRHGEYGQADELLAGMNPKLLPRSLEAASTFKAIAFWNLSMGRRTIAADRFNSMGHTLLGVERADWEGITFDLLSVATAVSEWGRPGQYDLLRDRMIGRFTGSANPTVAEHVIKATLLMPAGEHILRRLPPMAKVMEDSLVSPGTDRTHLLAWRQFSLALIAYREGRLGDAADWARRSLTMDAGSEHREVSNRLILAMVDLKQGDAGEVRPLLEIFRGEVERWTGGDIVTANPDGTLWYNQFVALILLREAEELLDESGG